MKHVSLWLGLAVLLLSSQAYALDPQKCFKVTHGMGLLRKYDFPGYSSAEYMTKKYGSTEGTTEMQSQSTTSLVDPGVTTGDFVSTSQFTSSDGGCSYFSENREKLRDYLGNYRALVLDQAAQGHGEHLRSVYFYASCKDGGLAVFEQAVQSRYGSLSELSTPDAMINALDATIGGNAVLAGLCAQG